MHIQKRQPEIKQFDCCRQQHGLSHKYRSAFFYQKNNAAQETCQYGGFHRGSCGYATHHIPMNTANQARAEPYKRPANKPAHNRAYIPYIYQHAQKVNADYRAVNGKTTKNEHKKQLVFYAETAIEHIHENSCSGKHISQHDYHSHLLQQRKSQFNNIGGHNG